MRAIVIVDFCYLDLDSTDYDYDYDFDFDYYCCYLSFPLVFDLLKDRSLRSLKYMDEIRLDLNC